MHRLSLLIAVAACGGSAGKSAAPISGSAPTSAIGSGQANRALHEDAPLDYERPLKQKPWDRSATTRLFHDNCRAGDKEACIVEAELVPRDARGPVLAFIETNCRVGHAMSCRALPRDTHELLYPDLPGAMSRRPECWRSTLPAPCDVAMLRKECTDGFPGACIVMAAIEPPLPDADALSARGDALSLEGCRAGIASDCSVAGGSEADVQTSAERSCELHRENCMDLAIVFERRKDSLHEREAKERACQYTTGWWECIALGNDYLDHKLEEPIAGRGQALLDYGCRKAAAANEMDESLCKRAKLR